MRLSKFHNIVKPVEYNLVQSLMDGNYNIHVLIEWMEFLL